MIRTIEYDEAIYIHGDDLCILAERIKQKNPECHEGIRRFFEEIKELLDVRNIKKVK